MAYIKRSINVGLQIYTTVMAGVMGGLQNFEYFIPGTKIIVGCTGTRTTSYNIFIFKGQFYFKIANKVVLPRPRQMSPLQLVTPIVSAGSTVEDAFKLWREVNNVVSAKGKPLKHYLRFKLKDGKTVDMPRDIKNPGFPYLKYNELDDCVISEDPRNHTTAVVTSTIATVTSTTAAVTTAAVTTATVTSTTAAVSNELSRNCTTTRTAPLFDDDDDDEDDPLAKIPIPSFDDDDELLANIQIPDNIDSVLRKYFPATTASVRFAPLPELSNWTSVLDQQ